MGLATAVGSVCGVAKAVNVMGAHKALCEPTKADYLREVLSGLTVALALVPEARCTAPPVSLFAVTHQPNGSHPAPSQAVAFAFVAGVEPLVGLQAAWIVGLIEQIFGDRPGMITGATGALAVVMPPLTRPCQRGCDQPGEGQLTGCPLGAPVDEDGCVTPQFASPEKLGLLFYAVILQGLIQLL